MAPVFSHDDAGSDNSSCFSDVRVVEPTTNDSIGHQAVEEFAAFSCGMIAELPVRKNVFLENKDGSWGSVPVGQEAD